MLVGQEGTGSGPLRLACEEVTSDLKIRPAMYYKIRLGVKHSLILQSYCGLLVSLGELLMYPKKRIGSMRMRLKSACVKKV